MVLSSSSALRLVTLALVLAKAAAAFFGGMVTLAVCEGDFVDVDRGIWMAKLVVAAGLMVVVVMVKNEASATRMNFC